MLQLFLYHMTQMHLMQSCLEIEEFNDFIYEVRFHEWICTSTFINIFKKSSKEQLYKSKITIYQKHIQCCICCTQLKR